MRYLLLDFDGTLVDHDKREIYEALVRQVLAPADEQLSDELAELAKEMAKYETNRNAAGDYDREHVFLRFRQRFQGKEPAELLGAYWHSFKETQKIKDGCEETLAKMQSEGHRLVCVTDTDGPGGCKRERVRKAFGTRFFEGPDLFIGSENGLLRKGSQAFLQAVLDALGARVDQCIMVGDKKDIDLSCPSTTSESAQFLCGIRSIQTSGLRR
jgi:FMN phosphatase YigB (HAD superfamily)